MPVVVAPHWHQRHAKDNNMVVDVLCSCHEKPTALIYFTYEVSPIQPFQTQLFILNYNITRNTCPHVVVKWGKVNTQHKRSHRHSNQFDYGWCWIR